MPKYIVTMETDRATTKDITTATHRARRSDEHTRTLRISMTSSNIIHALQAAIYRYPHYRPIAAEEQFVPGEQLSDEQLTTILLDPQHSQLDPDDPIYADEEYIKQSFGFYYEQGFGWYIEAIANALRSADITPGLTVDVQHNDHGNEHAMLHVYDVASNTYRSVFNDTKDIAVDIEATGWNAVLLITRIDHNSRPTQLRDIMEHTITLTVEQLAAQYTTLGEVSLIGDAQGRSLLTGDIEPSNVVPGTHLIETEHGTIYLENSYNVTIQLG